MNNPTTEFETALNNGNTAYFKNALSEMLTNTRTWGEYIYEYLFKNYKNRLSEKAGKYSDIPEDTYHELIKELFSENGFENCGSLSGSTRLNQLIEQFDKPATKVSRACAYLCAFGLGMNREDLCDLMQKALLQQEVNLRDYEEAIYFWYFTHDCENKKEGILDMIKFYEDYSANPKLPSKEITSNETELLLHSFVMNRHNETQLKEYLCSLKNSTIKQTIYLGNHIYEYLFKKHNEIFYALKYNNVLRSDYHELIKKLFSQNGFGSFATEDTLAQIISQFNEPSLNISREVIFLLAFGLGMNKEDLSELIERVLIYSKINFCDYKEVIYFWCFINDCDDKLNTIQNLIKFYVEYSPFSELLSEESTLNPAKLKSEDFEKEIKEEYQLREYLCNLKKPIVKHKKETQKHDSLTFGKYIYEYLFQNHKKYFPKTAKKYSDISKDIYHKLIKELFSQNGFENRGSFTTSDTLDQLIAQFDKPTTEISKESIYLLAFGLGMSRKKFSSLIKKVCLYPNVNFCDYKEVICFWCFINDCGDKLTKIQNLIKFYIETEQISELVFKTIKSTAPQIQIVDFEKNIQNEDELKNYLRSLKNSAEPIISMKQQHSLSIRNKFRDNFKSMYHRIDIKLEKYIYEYLFKKHNNNFFKNDKNYTDVPETDYHELIKKLFSQNGFDNRGSFTTSDTLDQLIAQFSKSAKKVNREVIFLLAFGLGMSRKELSLLMEKVFLYPNVNFCDYKEVIYFWCFINDCGDKLKKIQKLFTLYNELSDEWSPSFHSTELSPEHMLAEDFVKHVKKEVQLIDYLHMLKTTAPKPAIQINDHDITLSCSQIIEQLNAQREQYYNELKSYELLDPGIARALFSEINWSPKTLQSRFDGSTRITRNEFLLSAFLFHCTPLTADKCRGDDLNKLKADNHDSLMDILDENLIPAGMLETTEQNPFDLFLSSCMLQDKPYEYLMANWYLAFL